jgi:hypothetical protein
MAEDTFGLRVVIAAVLRQAQIRTPLPQNRESVPDAELKPQDGEGRPPGRQAGRDIVPGVGVLLQVNTA